MLLERALEIERRKNCDKIEYLRFIIDTAIWQWYDINEWKNNLDLLLALFILLESITILKYN